jgi:hypothetical protein
LRTEGQTHRQTGMMKLIVNFRNFAKAPKMITSLFSSYNPKECVYSAVRSEHICIIQGHMLMQKFNVPFYAKIKSEVLFFKYVKDVIGI